MITILPGIDHTQVAFSAVVAQYRAQAVVMLTLNVIIGASFESKSLADAP